MKAVFVDGINCHHIGHALGIARFNLHALHKLLTEDIGTVKELVGPPMITVTPPMGKNVARPYRAVGFEVVEITSANSADDQAIIQRINSLGSNVTEIVLVSTDQDYIAALRQKVQHGVKVWWVGASVNGPTGTPLMTPNLKPFFGTEFNFVDLLSHKDQIMGVPKKMPVAAKPKSPTRNLKIELNGATQDECLDVIASLMRSLRKMPHIKYKIES